MASSLSVPNLARNGSSYIVEPLNPDREPTRQEDAAAPAPVEAQVYSLDLNIIDEDGEPEQGFKQVGKHLYRRNFGGWYARVPDQKPQGSRSLPITAQDGPSNVAPQTNGGEPAKSKPKEGRVSPQTSDSSISIFLRLPWETEKVGQKRKLVLHNFQEDFRGTVAHPKEKPARDAKTRKSKKVKKSKSHVGTPGGSATNGPASTAHGADVNIHDPPLQSTEARKPSVDRLWTSQSLLWQHAKYTNLSIDRLREQVKSCEPYGVSETEYSLFDPHVTDRLKHDFRGSQNGSSYLRPLTLRYAIQHLESDIVDQSCVFFSFPYLSLMKLRAKSSVVQEMDHVPRALLQSKYHRHDTRDRDKNQQIRSLGLDRLKEFITGSEEVKAEALASLGPSKKALSKTRRVLSLLIPGLKPDPFDERLHIPQLWGVLPGSNNLITCDTCDVDSLCGENIRLASGKESSLPQAKSLLKLKVVTGGHSEEFHYPLDHGDSWYGLLSKHLAIEESAFRAKSKKSSFRGRADPVKLQSNGQTPGNATDPTGQPEHVDGQDPDFRTNTYEKMEVTIQIEGQGESLNSQGWIQYLKTHINAETIAVQMGNSLRKDLPIGTGITTSSGADRNSLQGQSGGEGSSQDTANPLRGDAPIKMAPLLIQPPPDGSTFLEWPLRNEFDQENDMFIKTRSSKFLEAIFEKMKVQKNEAIWLVPSRSFDGKQFDDTRLGPLSRAEFVQWRNAEFSGSGPQKDAAERLDDYLKKTLRFFIPGHVIEAPDLNSQAMQIFWGAIRLILTEYKIKSASLPDQAPKTIEKLLQSLGSIMKTAKKLHMGVRAITRNSTPGQTPFGEGLTGRTVLLSSIVDAFSHVLLLAVVAAATKDDDGTDIEEYTRGIIVILEKAQGKLIREADKDLESDTPGPILTPESTTIALMNRLVAGTCDKASLNIVGIYQLCLEKMALEVKFEFSRSLLSNLNAFVEEATVIGDVLKQQMNVLLQFRASLDPTQYHNPTIARHLQFRYESQEIDRILIRIREQVRVFDELCERAKQLSQENVQLVETSQEQNGKYIFVFTVVTILFLPPSFVSSFFGMNMHGIMDISWGVKHFWEIAVPLTAGVVVAALIFARTIDRMLAAFSRWWSRKKSDWSAD